MNLFTWLVPPLLPLIILFCFSTFTQSLSPWIFPFCLGIESFSFFVFQLFRLEQPRSLLHLLKPSWSLSLNLKSILFRVCLSFPVILYHVLIVLIFKSKVLEPSTALLLHVLQPSLNLIYQMSSLFWVEHLQYYSVRGIFIKLRKLFLWISFIWWLVFLILQIDLYWMAPLIWVQFELLNFWLGIPANSNQRLLPTSLSTSLKSWKVKTVRSFWNQQKRETLLKKYNIPTIYNNEVEKVIKLDNGIFEVHTKLDIYKAKNVVIAIGKMGKPNKPNYKIASEIQKNINFNLSFFVEKLYVN
jgi:hypothetical protein